MNLIGTIFQLILLIFSKWLEHDAEKKKAKQEAVNTVIEGIKNNDPSQITEGFSSINNL
jgi:hypothetical protein